jgi:electron transfer flavoprotein beta subunit
LKILVPFKRTIDPAIKPRIRPDGSGVDLAGIRMSPNPFDEIALEQALRLKEQGLASEIIVVAIGPRQVAETLRTGLAMGADRAIAVLHEDRIEPLDIARILAAIVQRDDVGLVLAGKQSIDGDNGQTGQMLAGLLAWPQATFISALTIDGDGNVQATREVDSGLVTLGFALPAVITADLRLNQPRHPSLPNVMKSRNKPLLETSPQELGIDIVERVALLKVCEPPSRPKGQIVASVDELIAKLTDEAQVL